MQLNRQDIAALIPHSGAMSLLNQVLQWDKDHIICLANNHWAKDNPLRSNNILSSVCGIEYAAQAMAVHGILSEPEPTEKPSSGFLVSVRKLELSVSRLDDIEPDMIINAKLLMMDKETFIYRFRISADNRDLLSGQATIFIRRKSIP